MPESSASFGRTLSYAQGAVSLSEVISAMTFALDLTEGAMPGHALRCCLLGMRIGRAMGLSAEMQASLYYALQLKDIGCSNNAARMTEIVGGDDRAAKSVVKLCDWTRPHRTERRTVRMLWANVLPGKRLPRRVMRFVWIGLTQHRNNRRMIQLRCERGAEIVRKLEVGELAAEAVRCLDEHWNGTGYPNGLEGAAIPMLARICSVAQNLDVFAIEDGPDVAMGVLRERSGRWFDPEIVAVVERLHASGELWESCLDGTTGEETRLAVLALDPGAQMEMDAEHVDRICEAFAGVVDAKSPFTYRHSIGVADAAVAIAEEMGLEPERVQLVRRAALLHDLGKLRVPNTILDKMGRLTAAEWKVVLEHPKLTRSILERVSSFRELAVLASEHHEKLDGSGYPEGLRGEAMSVESRVLAVADCYAALAEKRPYREALADAEILELLRKSVPEKLDAGCFAALERVVGRRAKDAGGESLRGDYAGAGETLGAE